MPRKKKGGGGGSTPLASPSAVPTPALPIDPDDPFNPLDQAAPSAIPVTSSTPAATPPPTSRMPTVDEYRNMTPAQQRRVIGTYGQSFLDALEQHSIQAAQEYRTRLGLDTPEPPGFINPDAGWNDDTDVLKYKDALDKWLSPPDDTEIPLSPEGRRDVEVGSNDTVDNPEPFDVTHNNSSRQGTTYGPADFIGNRFNGFNITRYIDQSTHFPANSPYQDNQVVVPDGRVLIGNEDASGSLSYDSNLPFDAPMGPVVNPDLMADAQALDPASPALSTTSSGVTRTAPAPTKIGVGTSTAHNAPLGTTNNPLFGVGSKTGQHYYNAGNGWVPIGQAPSDVRWANNSGTSNANATASTDAYVLGGGDPGAPNNTRGTGDEGRTAFSPGSKFIGQTDEAGNLYPVLASGLGPSGLAPWVMPSQSVAASLDLSHNNAESVQRLNDWIAQNNQGNISILNAWKNQNSPASNLMDSIPTG